MLLGPLDVGASDALLRDSLIVGSVSFGDTQGGGEVVTKKMKVIGRHRRREEEVVVALAAIKEV